MLTHVHPKLPMREREATLDFYCRQLGFSLLADYGNYLLLVRDQVEIHFFEHRTLNIYENYGQVYIRCNQLEQLYNELVAQAVPMPAGTKLEAKPWGQKEFSVLDPDHNLLTFGEAG